MTTKFCCKQMQQAFEDKEFPLGRLRRSAVLYTGYGCTLKCFKYKDGLARLVDPIAFCPWCSAEQEFAFELRLESEIFMKCHEQNIEYPENGFRFDIPYYETKIPKEFRYLCRDRTWYYKKLKKWRLQHTDISYCDIFEENEVGYNRVLFYYENARFFGIIRKTSLSISKHEEFMNYPPENIIPINYCYECGAKLPERLDKKLSEILQNEYGLQSWRDYKKAPHEFHTDEWWKKRGL